MPMTPGKTTTLRILHGLLNADAGQAILLGGDPSAAPWNCTAPAPSGWTGPVAGLGRLEPAACPHPAAHRGSRRSVRPGGRSCRDRRSEQDQGPGRPGRVGLAFLIAAEDTRPQFEQAPTRGMENRS